MIAILFSKFFAALCNYAYLRLILLTLSLIGIAIFALPLSVRIINIGNMFGLSVSLILLICVLFRKKLQTLTDTLLSHRAGKVSLCLLAALVIAGILYCAVMSILMLHAAHKKPDTAPKAMIVLGCKVRGEEPSLMLYRRIQAAYAAMQEYPDMTVIASGGQGNDEDISEAQCIYDTLVTMGADKKRILMENKSTTTSENMQFSKRILEEHGISPESVILITSDGYHEMRAQMLAGYEGLPSCFPASAKTAWYLLPTYFVREWFGIAHAFVFHS